VSSLTQPSSFGSAGVSPVSTEREQQMARQLNIATEKIHELKDDPRMVKEQLAVMMERQRGDTSTGTS